MLNERIQSLVNAVPLKQRKLYRLYVSYSDYRSLFGTSSDVKEINGVSIIDNDYAIDGNPSIALKSILDETVKLAYLMIKK